MFNQLFLSITAILFCNYIYAQENIEHSLPDLPVGVQAIHANNPLKEALKPVPETAIFEMDGWSLWDPSVIKIGDTYHLFCSRWKESDGWDTWRNSHIIRATSKSLFGPYQFQEIVMMPEDHPWAKEGLHNPKIIKSGDNFLLYHLGIPRWVTGFMFSKNIEGPWEPLPESILPTNNPSLLIHKNGNVYAVGKFKPNKADTKDGKWDAYMHAFEAPDILGPYKLVADDKNRLSGNFELEDPTVWWANNQYNVICTDWESKVTGSVKAVLMYISKDGENYMLYSQIPIWTKEEGIPLVGGDNIKTDKIERPQVYTSKDGTLKALLVSATKQDNKDCGIIVIRPVDNFTPEN